jgi:hypothetical protein
MEQLLTAMAAILFGVSQASRYESMPPLEWPVAYTFLGLIL